MLDLKKKAIGGIKNMLEDRLSNRMRPQPSPEPESEEAGEDPAEKRTESPGEEKMEESQELDLPDGADLSRLSSQEQQELKDLYAKMGC